MRIGVLGTLQLLTADGEAVAIPEAKVRMLLAALLVRQGQVVSADRLIDELWGEKLPRDPARVLRAKLSQLRGVLERAETGGRDRVVRSGAGYRLDLDNAEVDLTRFRELVESAQGTADPRGRHTTLTEALELWRGPALADFIDEPWARPLALRLDEEWLTAAEESAEARLALGEHQRLANEIGELVNRHPTRERLHTVYLEALYRSGRQAEALESFERLRHRLAEELGADPGPAITALHQEMLRQSPNLEAGSRPRSNLPAMVNEIIDRQRETAEIQQLLKERRLVTLTGPGGVGKTRLSLEVAGQAEGMFGDGIWLVDLSSLPESLPVSTLSEAVAEVLEIRFSTGNPAAELASALRDMNCLLMLDNCEHVIDSAAELVSTLLASAAKVTCLTTSREPLEIPGEYVFNVDTLTVSDDGASGAVRLFTARAQAVAPNFTLNDETMPAVVSICRQLDGLPLAVELAANRVRSLGVDQLAGRLNDRFALLASTSRGVPKRQQTLRAVIDWSWQMLTPAERAVLCSLTVHSGGCTLEAAEAVSAGPDTESTGVLEPLSRLVDRSLVTTVDHPTGLRYRLLESIAAYARERLAEAEQTAATEQRHMRYYRDLVGEIKPLLHGPQQKFWVQRMVAESGNLRTAFDTAMSSDADAALRLAVDPIWFWQLQGRYSEARRRLEAALSLTGGDPHYRAMARAWLTFLRLVAREVADPVAETKAVLEFFDGPGNQDSRPFVQWLLAPALVEVGELELSESLIGQALSTFRARNNTWGIALSLAHRSYLAQIRGERSRFDTDAQRSLELFTELGDPWGQLEAMSVLWRAAETSGEHSEAMRISREGLALSQDLGLWRHESFWLSSLARGHRVDGEYDKARELHERARRRAAEHGAGYDQRFAELGLGLVARRAGDFDRAEPYLRAWLGGNPAEKGSIDVAILWAELGFLAEQRGDSEQAAVLHLEGLRMAESTGSPHAIAMALTGVAGVLAMHAEAALAARMLGAADAAYEAAGVRLVGTERQDIDRITAAVRAALSAEEVASERETGNRQPHRAAAAEAREILDRIVSTPPE